MGFFGVTKKTTDEDGGGAASPKAEGRNPKEGRNPNSEFEDEGR